MTTALTAGPVSGTVWVHCRDASDGTPQLAAHLSEALTGQRQTLPNMRYWATGDTDTDGDHERYTVEYLTETPRHDGPTITVSLTVENTYEQYCDVTAYVVDAVIAAAPADRDCDEYDEWAQEHIIDPFTGVGNESGDSWYDVTVTACSDPTLIAATFDWGY